MNGSAASTTPFGDDAVRGLLIRSFTALSDLPPAAVALFVAPGEGSLFATAAWFATVIAAGLEAGSAPCFVAIGAGEAVQAVVPLKMSEGGGRLEALTSPYTCLYRPLLGRDLPRADISALGMAFGRFCRAWPMVRLDALPGDAPDLAAFLHGTRRAGLLCVAFDHFGNWHETVAGQSWAAYLRARPGGLRETIRRKLARAERDPRIAFEILRRPQDGGPAIAAFESVYARSWKEAEPFPRFNATLIACAAELGLLRLGVLWAEGVAVAVQLWVVGAGTATVLKLAHDEAAKALSPGTVLTAMMLRHLLDGEQVDEIDFGRGDDPYKQGWARARRQRVGVVLVNPWRPAGLAFAARHLAGRALRRWRRG
jgi:hypothetical protein